MSSVRESNRFVWRDVLVAALLFGIVVTNGVVHVAAGRWYDAFWLCNWCVLSVAAALALRSSWLATVAWIWLLPGTAAWFVEVLAAVRFAASSYALHAVGLAGAFYALRRLGAQRGVVWGSLIALGAVLLGSRLLPDVANVNGVFGPRRGWTTLAATGSAYPLAVAALAVIAAWLGQASALFVARGARPVGSVTLWAALNALRIRAQDPAP
jgi:hypothetical protein